MNEEANIDCSGFNFYLQPDKSYVVFDPQSQEENDRLGDRLGAKAFWDQAIKTHTSKATNGAMDIFTELYPVGLTLTAENVAVVVAGAVTCFKGKPMVDAQWFAVRFKEDSRAEVIADLESNIRKRQEFLRTSTEKPKE